ncbi:MAG: glycoside hydrolase family 88 protein [candidate division KSB1 bacterium]|nr:glycoside hydrolase family 88 protein [candidate division KSB1 bacterium]
MRTVYSLIFILIVVFLPCCEKAPNISVQDNFERAEAQYKIMLEKLDSFDKYPRSLEDDSLKLITSSDWTSGFFPGSLWYLYEWTGNENWKEAAQNYTMPLKDEQYNDSTHDLGFMMYCSFGNAFRLTGNRQYRDVLLQSAQTLISRYNPIVGCIQSWDWSDQWQYPVIIDNMMNLELLFRAAKELGDSTFYSIAVSHADHTLNNHFREDYSTWHVLDYDTTTGKVLSRETHQGYSDESTWSRGQAWALYGYSMCYRETGYERYLDQAVGIADYVMTHENLPEDGVPYWDFNAPDIPDAPRDASAAAIMCSALYELYQHSNEKAHRQFADRICASLSGEKYKGREGFILDHSVGSKPSDSEVDVPLNYADYYYLEANLRKSEL